jgi:hypothetical protein
VSYMTPHLSDMRKWLGVLLKDDSLEVRSRPCCQSARNACNPMHPFRRQKVFVSGVMSSACRPVRCAVDVFLCS